MDYTMTSNLTKSKKNLEKNCLPPLRFLLQLHSLSYQEYLYILILTIKDKLKMETNRICGLCRGMQNLALKISLTRQ